MAGLVNGGSEPSCTRSYSIQGSSAHCWLRGSLPLACPPQAQGQATAHTAATHLFVKRDNAETLEPSATMVSRVMLMAD